MRKTGIFIMSLLILTTSFAAQPDYGAETANTSFFSDVSGGATGFNYLALKDHIGPSGVPFGGVGTGCFDLAPTGEFTRIALNNTHEDGVIKDVKASFFAIWENNTRRKKITHRRMVRDDSEYLGLKGYASSIYRGLFPTARVAFKDRSADEPRSRLSLYGWSGCVPHNIKDSSLPVAFFEVSIVNTENRPIETSIALSWEDIISRGLLDLENKDALDKLPKNNAFHVKRANWVDYPRVETFSEPFEVGKWKGIKQFTPEPFDPIKATYQNYVQEVAILAEETEGTEVTVLPAYEVNNGEQKWKTFKKDGTFAKDFDKVQLYDPDEAKEKASAIALKLKLDKAETKTVRFMVAWYYPQLKIDREKAHPKSYFGTQDYGRYFHKFFDGISDIVAYSAQNYSRIHEGTVEWHKPILESTYPDWLKFKLINSAYVLYTNSILNRAGDFAVMEGKMGGLAGTMDQRLSAHPFYQKFFTDLDRAEMDLFAYTQDPEEGFILHFNGHYYLGIATREGLSPAPKGTMLDNTCSWIIQLAKDYQQTRGEEYVKEHYERVKFAFENLKNNIKSDIDIPVGKTTYDDYIHPPVYSYIAGVYLSALEAGKVLADCMDDDDFENKLQKQLEETRKDFIKYLWNGRFFSYGCDLDGSDEQDYRMFTGQLAGQFVSRYCGWGDVVPQKMARASVLSQFKTSVSSAPSYYAPKVYDLNLKRGIDKSGSQCWPFYLESYTAMLGIQNGYLEDGLAIMKNIQLVHLREGWTWTQNLWNPGEATYMSAPVTWFITDVLAGASFDGPEKLFRLAPVIRQDAEFVRYPLFYPRFWATLEIDMEKETVKLKIEKMYRSKPMKIFDIEVVPAGKPASEAIKIDVPNFKTYEGDVLDLSEHFDIITSSVQNRPVLHRAGQVPFIEVDSSEFK